MPSATEYLRLIIDADGKGAVRGLEQVGKAADRSLGTADDRLKRVGAQLTTFGATTVAAAAVAGAGLFKVAQSASAYGEQVSRATKTFGDEAVPQLEEFAAAAAESAGISQTAAVKAASTFAAFGKQIGLSGGPLAEFSSGLVQLAGDFSSFQDISTDEALTTFISALSGEQEAIKRYGIDLSAARVQQEALNTGLAKSASALTEADKVQARYNILLQEGTLFAGDFVDTSDSLANQQRQLAAEFENAKVALGNGLLPLATSAVGVVGGLADQFNRLTPAQQSAIGKFTGLATAAAGTVGALSLVVGQAAKLSDRFYTVSGSGTDATRSLTNVGKAAVGLGAIGIGVGIVAALQEITSSGDDATVSIDNLKVALAIGDDSAALDAIIERTRELDGAVDDILETVRDLPRVFDNPRWVNLDGAVVDVYNLKEALEETTDASEGLAAIQAIRNAGYSGTGADQLTQILEEQEEAFKAQARAAGLSDRSTRAARAGFGVLKAEVEETTGAIEGNADAFLNAIQAQRSYSDAQRDLSDAYRDLRDLQKQALSAEDEAAGLRSIEDAARGVEDAYRSLEDAQRSVADARLELSRSEEDLIEGLKDLEGVTRGTVEFDEGSDKVRDLARRREDAQRGVEDALRREQDAQRGVADAQQGVADAQRDLNEARREALPTQEEYAEALRAVDDANLKVVESGLKEAAALLGIEGSSDEAKAALLRLAQNAPPEVQNAVALMIAQIDLLDTRLTQFAEREPIDLAELFRDKNPKSPFAGARASGSVDIGPRYERPDGRAVGGPVEANELYSVNEFGRELFLPKTDGYILNAGDTSRLLDGLNKGSKGGNVYNITAPPSTVSTPEDLVRAMRSSEFLYEGVG